MTAALTIATGVVIVAPVNTSALVQAFLSGKSEGTPTAHVHA